MTAIHTKTSFNTPTSDTLPDKLEVFCPAKLNLFLHITGKKENGYHSLQSVLTCLDIGDTLTITPKANASRLITLTGAKGLTDKLDDNLISQAAHTLYQYATTMGSPTLTPFNIHLTKRLPTGAGLGGGSSNAAMTLLALNKLWQLNLNNKTLQWLGQKLGADIPFFVANTPSAIAEGIGEILTPITLPSARYLLLSPAVHNDTGAFFCHPSLKKDTLVIPHTTLQQMSQTGFMVLTPPLYNAFEHIARQTPAIDTALTYLESLSWQTHTTARLTGTGSSVFLPIPDHISKKTLESWVQNAPCQASVAHSYRPITF